MKLWARLVGFCALGLQMNIALGFSSGSATLTRQFDMLSAVTNSQITVTATLTNGGSSTLRGVYYVDQVPSGLTVKTVGVWLNGLPVTNYLVEAGAVGDVYAGCTPYRWILETPPTFSQNKGVGAGGVVQVVYSVTSARLGSFSMQYFGWSGYDPGSTNASFGVSEAADAASVNFTLPVVPSYPILALSATNLTFAATQGSASSPQSLGIANNGGGTLNWAIAVESNAPAWLAVSPSNGSSAASVTVTAASSSLAAGTYSKTLTVTAAGATNSPQVVTVNLVITPQTSNQGLVAHWSFDEGSGTQAIDSSGNGYNLSLMNGPAWTTGKFSGGLSFNGVNNYAMTPSINLSGTAAVSVSLWVKRNYTIGGTTVLYEFSRDFNSSATSFMFFPDDSRGLSVGLLGNAGYNIKAYSQPGGGVWHHIVVIYDKSQGAATEVTLYLDGVLQTGSLFYTADNSNAFGNNPFYLFSRGGSQYFGSGVIDEMRIYNRAITAAEVSQLYGAGSTPDTQAPSIPGTPAATVVSSSQINLSWGASTDNVGVAGYQIYRNTNRLTNVTTTSWSDTGLAPGTLYSYTIAAYDAAGNVSAQSSPGSATTAAIDTVPPSIAFTAPPLGAVVSNTVVVSVTATDNVAVAGVQFKLDGANLGNEVTTTPYQVSWNTLGATNGGHTLSALARDGAGNTSNATLVVTVSNSTNTTIPTQGLVAYWAFDETSGTQAADSSGNGYNLRLVNGPTWTTGKVNGALSFNGVNNYAVSPAIGLSGTAAVSVSFWIKRTYVIGGTTVLFESSRDFNSSTTGFMFFPDDSRGIAAGLRGNVGYNLKAYIQPSSGAWHHIVVIYDKGANAANEVTCYIDGALWGFTAQLNSANNTNPFGSNPLYLFSRAGSQYFGSGVIDEMRIYSRGLTAAEVTQLYSQGAVALAQPLMMSAIGQEKALQLRDPVLGSGGFGFAIDGPANGDLVVEVCTNLADPVWTPVETNAGPWNFGEPQWTNYPARFYRVRVK